MGFLDFVPLIGKVLDRVLPDPAAKAAAQLELVRLAQAGELAHLDAEVKLAVGQMEINKAEATNPSLFVSGWRPFTGWGCGLGLVTSVLIGPLFTWIAALVGHPTPFPVIDTSILMTTLAGMLGLGGMRTYEKLNDKARV